MINSFNFDQLIDRRHTDSEKWAKYQGQDILPLWVADTDFAAPPAVTAALQQRVAHSVFGYGFVPDSMRDAVVDHVRYYFDWAVEAEWLMFLPGLVCGLNLVTRACCDDGLSVLMPTPIYPPFKNAALFNNRPAVDIPMRLDDGRWVLDLEQFEAQAKAHPGALFLFCNPQNPGGTVYRREELMAISDIADRYGLIVCSDEIHADLVLEPGVKHIPFASLDTPAAAQSIVLMAPSKTFNIAGLGCSVAIVPDASLRNKLMRAARGIIPHVNVLGLVAAEAAYRQGRDWLAEQLRYLRANRDQLVAKVQSLPGLEMVSPEATYLGWIDCRALQLKQPEHYFEQHGLGLSPGQPFGNGQFVRLNFGCRNDTLSEALNRLEQAITAL